MPRPAPPTVDDALAELVAGGEAWAWAVPHPDDPVPAEHPVVTRIGARRGGRLDGYVALSTTRRRVLDHARHLLEGAGPWRGTSLGSLGIPHTETGTPGGRATVSSGGLAGSWNAAGRLQVGDHRELSALATRGAPPTAAVDLRGAADLAIGIGKALVRRARGDRDALDGLDAVPPPSYGAVVDVPLAAFDGWLTASQHLAEGPDGTVESWRLDLDAAVVAPASPGVALVLAAVALVHHPRLLT